MPVCCCRSLCLCLPLFPSLTNSRIFRVRLTPWSPIFVMSTPSIRMRPCNRTGTSSAHHPTVRLASIAVSLCRGPDAHVAHAHARTSVALTRRNMEAKSVDLPAPVRPTTPIFSLHARSTERGGAAPSDTGRLVALPCSSQAPNTQERRETFHSAATFCGDRP